MNAVNRQIAASIIIAAISLLVSGFVAFSSAQSDSLQRITAVEVQLRNDGERLNRIEGMLTDIYRALLGRNPQ